MFSVGGGALDDVPRVVELELVEVVDFTGERLVDGVVDTVVDTVVEGVVEGVVDATDEVGWIGVEPEVPLGLAELDVRGNAVPPGVSSAVLVSRAPLVEVHATIAADRINAAVARRNFERRCIQSPPARHGDCNR